MPGDAAGERIGEHGRRPVGGQQRRASFLPADDQAIGTGKRSASRPEVPIDLRVALDDPGKIRFCHDEDVQVGGRARTVATAGCPVRSEISPTEPQERRCRRDARFRPSRR